MNSHLAKPSFWLDSSFYALYEKREPKWGPIGRTVFFRTYVRRDPETDKVETVPQVFKRVVEGVFSILKNWCIETKRPWDEGKAQRQACKMFECFWSFKGLPSGRALWTMGTECIQKAGASALNNCAFTTTEHDLVRALMFMMDQSMLGVGVGFDVEGAGKHFVKGTQGTGDPYEIDDTREGWVDSVAAITLAHLHQKPEPRFIYDRIRPAGLPIRGFGGVSSGPEPLKQLHADLNRLFTSYKGRTIDSVGIADAMNYEGVCVVAGNVRRTAQLALGKVNDDGYFHRKDDRDSVNGPQAWRWASNDSFKAYHGMDYGFASERLSSVGDLGFMWIQTARQSGRLVDPVTFIDRWIRGCNPCGEIGLEDKEFCNLAEMYPHLLSDTLECYSILKCLYLFAKAVSLLETNWEDSNEVIARNHRLGISMSGLMQSFAVHGVNKTRRMCDSGYKFLKGIDEEYSAWLGVPVSVKLTTVQPSGTKSLLVGATPGLHPGHAPFYIRRVEFQDNDPSLEAFEAQGFTIQHKSAKRVKIVEFPIAEVPGTPTYKDSNLYTQVKRAAMFQKWWADNQVSCTVVVKEHEIEQIPEVLTLFEDDLKSISFLKEEHDFEYPPYEEITEAHYKERAGELHKKKINFEGRGVNYCEGDQCAL